MIFKIYMILFSVNLLIVIGSFNKIQNDKIKKIGLYYYSPLRRSEMKIKPSSKFSSYQNNRPLKVLIHGWTADRNHIAMKPIKNAYLADGTINIIIVDWRDAALQNYDLSRSIVGKIGVKIAKQLESFMKNMNIHPDQVHILGHSLGSHIAGNVGRYFNGNINRITSLDPAGPLFNRTSIDALMITDAKFVDTIHTGVGVLGEIIQRSHVSFFPNRGLPPQPGCLALDLLTVSACSHFRAPLFYAESILQPKQFISAECDLKSILFKSIKLCKPKYNLNGPRKITYMGENVSRNATGIYYLETNSAPPFGRGKYLL